jgi:hypothetical protein
MMKAALLSILVVVAQLAEVTSAERRKLRAHFAHYCREAMHDLSIL